MFHPHGHPMERGWVGRIDGDRVVHLAAQTLQSYFLGGGGAREHAEYALDDVELLAPVLHPPAVRVFEDAHRFAFANPAAIRSPGAEAHTPDGAEIVSAFVRPAAVVGAEGGVELPVSWFPKGEREWAERQLKPELRERLGKLPVELVLVSHGDPVLEHGADALRRGLA